MLRLRVHQRRSVSPNSIRSRILKVRPGAGMGVVGSISFTQFDPFEDTESIQPPDTANDAHGFTQFDPFEDTESAAFLVSRFVCLSFTQFDPFEDTERPFRCVHFTLDRVKFHPIRSVRGY